jgi:hypothetical protein
MIDVLEGESHLRTNKMRKLLVAALLAAIPTIAFPSHATAQTGYVEGAIGLSLLSGNLESDDDFSFVTAGGELFVGSAEGDYDGNWGFGAEIGFQTGPWRFGASWDFADAELESLTLNGTLDGVPFSGDITGDDEIAAAGLEDETDVNIFAANAYYVFDPYSLGMGSWSVQPYIGLGAGAATFSDFDTSFAFLVTAGVNVPILENGYVGARYRLAVISGPEGDEDVFSGGGVELDTFTTHTFSLVIGFRFGL